MFDGIFGKAFKLPPPETPAVYKLTTRAVIVNDDHDIKIKMSIFSDDDASSFPNHIDLEAHVGVPISTIAENGLGVTSRP